MSYVATRERSINSLKKHLKSIEKLIQSPDVRQADYVLRDRLARRIFEAERSN